MTATNHALTGALIGLIVHQPLAAVPIAFASHYTLDAFPHADGFFKISSKTFRFYLVIDALLCALIVLLLILTRPPYWWLGAICAFVAASPDFMWVKDFTASQKGLKLPVHKYWWVKLHAKIQWFAKPVGAVVEVVWAVCAIGVLVILVKK